MDDSKLMSMTEQEIGGMIRSFGDVPLLCHAVHAGHVICIREHGHSGSHMNSDFSRLTDDDLLRARVRELREKALSRE